MKIGGRSLLSAVLVLCVVLMTRAVTGSQTSISGELVETYCWGTKQIGGPGHAQCGIECAKRGIPVAVVDADSRKVFILVTGDHNAPLPAELIAAMGNHVTIRGEVFVRGGTQLIKVQSWSRAR